MSVIASRQSVGGLQPVASLPVATDTDFRKFLRALSDIDVKTAPTTERVPASIRSKLETLKLQPNERLIYSLYDGFLRFAGGYVHLGQDLQVVRLSRSRRTDRPALPGSSSVSTAMWRPLWNGKAPLRKPVRS